MKHKIFILLASLSALLVSCKPTGHYDEVLINCDIAKAEYYGDFYGNGCGNYILKLVCGRYDSEQNLVGAGEVICLDLNMPATNQLAVCEGVYVPLYGSMSPEYSFVRGTVNGKGELEGSYMLKFYGNEDNGEPYEITDGKISISYSGRKYIIDANLIIDGERFRVRYRGDIYLYDNSDWYPTNPNLVSLNSAEATNFGQSYNNVYADMWFLRLFDTDYELTGQSVEIELLAPVGLSSLPIGVYNIVDGQLVAGNAVAGWEDEDGYVHGTWYLYGGYARYGATEGSVIVERVGMDYRITFDCYDSIEKNSFTGVYSGPVTYISPDNLAISRAKGRTTKGDVLVSTASTKKGKHVGSGRLAR